MYSFPNLEPCPWFHVQFYLLLLDLHTDFSGGREGGPVVKNGLPLQGAQVGSLVRELRSHMLQPNAKAFDCVDQYKLRKILNEMGIPVHLTCLLRNLYAGQEATVRTGHGTTDWFQIGKGVHRGCILLPCLFNLYATYIMKTLCWRKHRLESRLPGEISITSDMQMTPPLWQKVKKN